MDEKCILDPQRDCIGKAEAAKLEGQEEQQVDALGGPLVHTQEEGHHQQQQRAAAYAPGGEDAGPQAAEKGKKPLRHSRYFTPA